MLREGGRNCLKYLKRGGTENRRGESKILKRGGQAELRDGCLKKGGLEPPYELCVASFFTRRVYQALKFGSEGRESGEISKNGAHALKDEVSKTFW